MLNLNDLSSDHANHFLDVSAIKRQCVPDQDDEECDDALSEVLTLRSRRPYIDSVGSRSVTSPWEFDFSSLSSSDMRQFQLGPVSSASNSTTIDQPTSSTHEVSFAILGDGYHPNSSAGLGVLQQEPVKTEAQPKQCRFGYAIVAAGTLLCIIIHAFGLLLFFTPWYNHSIQVSIFRRFYTSFSTSGFEQSVDAKRHAVAVVYLLAVGITPTVVASSLWFSFSSSHGLRSVIQTPRFMRRKPVLFAKWKPLYLDATWGELVLLVVLVVSNGLVFILSLLRSKTEIASPNEKLWRDVGRAFAFNAVFNLVWLLLFLPKPSAWTVYIDFFSIADERISTKYRYWLGRLTVSSSALHAFCMAIQSQLNGELRSMLFPDSRTITDDPTAGMILCGEIALGVMLLLAFGAALAHRIPHAVTLVVAPIGEVICFLALSVHYPVTIAWLLPTLVPLLIQQAVAWSHSRYPVELVDMAPLPNGITRLVLRRSVDTMERSGSHFVAGQSVNIRLPQVSWVQWQRCTIATSPVRKPGVFTVYIHPPTVPSTDVKVVDEIVAREIHDVAKVAYAAKRSPIVYVDGFYGPTHPIFYDKYPCLVFIADEIGVVKMAGILEQLYHEAWLAASSSFDRKIGQEVNEDADDASVHPVKPFDKQVWVLWSCADVCLFKEFEELFFRIKALDPQEIHFKVRLFLTTMPRHDDVLYQRLASAAFVGGSSSNPTDAKTTTRGLPTDVESANPCRRAPLRQPQNHSSLSCWASRPFQQAVSGVVGRITTLVLVIGAALTFTVLVEWYALRVTAGGGFPIVRLLRNTGMLLLACVVIAGIIALILDGLFSCQRNRQEQLYHDVTHHLQRMNQQKPPSRGLKKLRSMTKMVDVDNADANGDLERGSYQSDAVTESTAVGPDVMERLRIYSMRPDIDKFLRTVGRSFPSFAGTVRVFASGSKSLVELVEASTLACEASTGDWHNVKADLDFHRLG